MPAEKKLTNAMAEFVQEEIRRTTGKAADDGPKPSKVDVFVFVVFAVNLSLLIWTIPSELLKKEQLEFFEKIIPVVGGSLFALIVAWFKEKTVQVIRSPWFRWGQIPLACLALLLGAPVIPLHVKVAPADSLAILCVDKEDSDHMRDWNKTIWVSFTEHNIIVKHNDSGGWNPRFFHWKQRDLLRMLWRHHEVELPVLYSVRMNLQEPGLMVRIRKVNRQDVSTGTREEGTEFDDDFLRRDQLADQHLAEMDRQRITLTPRTSGDLSPLTKLPAGQYELSSWRKGCDPGKEVALTVPPTANAENCQVDLEPPKCPQ